MNAEDVGLDQVANKIGMSLEAEMEDDKGLFLLWSMTKQPA